MSFLKAPWLHAAGEEEAERGEGAQEMDLSFLFPFLGILFCLDFKMLVCENNLTEGEMSNPW